MAVGLGAVADLGWHIRWHIVQVIELHQELQSFTPAAQESVVIIAGALKSFAE
jgi:hypothetical protein